MRQPVRGRPKSRGEIAEVRKGIRFRPSEAERLEKMKRETGVPVSTFIKRVVDEALDKYEKNEFAAIAAIDEEKSTDTDQPILAPTHAPAPSPNTFTFPVSQPIYTRFSAFAEEVGYTDPNQLAKDLVMAAANDTEAAHDFLFGEIQEEAYAAAQAREEEIDAAKDEEQAQKKVA